MIDKTIAKYLGEDYRSNVLNQIERKKKSLSEYDDLSDETPSDKKLFTKRKEQLRKEIEHLKVKLLTIKDNV